MTTNGRATYTIPVPTDEVAAECHRVSVYRWNSSLAEDALGVLAHVFRPSSACSLPELLRVARALGASLPYLPTHHIAQAVAACAAIAPVADTVGTLPKEVLVGVVSLGIPQ